MEHAVKPQRPFFEDMTPLMERGQGSTYTIRSYVHGGGLKLVGRVYVTGHLEAPKRLWEEIQKDFPSATHINEGKILNCNKIVPWSKAGIIPSYRENYMKLDKSGVIWEKKYVKAGESRLHLWAPLNGYYEALGSIGFYQFNGRIWMDKFMGGREDHIGQDDHYMRYNVPDPMTFLYRKDFKA